MSAVQNWKSVVRGSSTFGNSLTAFFNTTSSGKTVLQAQDFIGPIDLGSPACCQSGCTVNDFTLQPIWDKAIAAGLDLSVYAGTAVAWPAMNVAWSGLAIIHCSGSYNCWS